MFCNILTVTVISLKYLFTFNHSLSIIFQTYTLITILNIRNLFIFGNNNRYLVSCVFADISITDAHKLQTYNAVVVHISNSIGI